MRIRVFKAFIQRVVCDDFQFISADRPKRGFYESFGAAEVERVIDAFFQHVNRKTLGISVVSFNRKRE